MFEKRIETDSMGEVEIPKEALYGAQTARSLIHFKVGDEKMPDELIMQYALLKKVCAETNENLGMLDKVKKDLIVKACDEILNGKHKKDFPLYVYQTGSGTQTNMNLNEVIANIANLAAKQPLGTKRPIHPNDDVNMSQSSNDSFPTVMHMTAVHIVEKSLIPTLKILNKELQKKQDEFDHIIKIGRTHLMDAVPISLGQEFSGYVAQIEDDINRLTVAIKELYELPIGGSAVGTGMNTHKDFASKCCKKLSEYTKKDYTPSKNKFSQIASHDRLVNLSSVFKTISVSLLKITGDLAWMGSGPRCGLNELILPENEPGSSIMPGKINPTQCEALSMVAIQVHGYDASVSMAGARGNFELNTYKPLIINNIVKSASILSDAMANFTQYFIIPLKANEEKIASYLQSSLMLVTALSPHIGYDMAAQIAKYAYENNTSLKEAAVYLKILTPQEYDKLVDIQKMINPE